MIFAIFAFLFAIAALLLHRESRRLDRIYDASLHDPPMRWELLRVIGRNTFFLILAWAGFLINLVLALKYIKP